MTFHRCSGDDKAFPFINLANNIHGEEEMVQRHVGRQIKELVNVQQIGGRIFVGWRGGY